MILVCPRCNAQYEARLKDPSKPTPKGNLKIRCLACGNPYLATEGSIRQDLFADLLESPKEAEHPNSAPISGWKGAVEDRDPLPDFPSFEEIEEPFGAGPSCNEGMQMPRVSSRSLLFPVFLVSLLLGIAIGGVMLYRAFRGPASLDSEPRVQDNAPSVKPEGLSNIPFYALTFERIHVEKRKNRFGETLVLVRGRVKNLGTLAVHERVRAVARAYAKKGQLKETKTSPLGNDITPSIAEEASVFELIARSELPSPEGMVVPLEPAESLPFWLVFPDDGRTIDHLDLSIETGPQEGV
jgi:hypothetical protein